MRALRQLRRITECRQQLFSHSPAKSRSILPFRGIQNSSYHLNRKYGSKMANVMPEGALSDASETTKDLPPLSQKDFMLYNKISVRMDAYHNHFRASWNELWNACTTGRRPHGMSLKAFIREGLLFSRQLEMHHGIEEAHIFPELAKQMPEFRNSPGPMVTAHQQIHRGLSHFQEYLQEALAGQVDFEMSVMKEKMEAFGEVLWSHLDEEVKALGAENMRKYWTKEQMARLPMTE